MQKARRHPSTGLRPLVGARFQVLFHPPPGVLFTFPSRYSPLSVSREYLALPDGAGCFRRGSSGPALLRVPPDALAVPPTGLSPPAARLSRRFGYRSRLAMAALLPRPGRNPDGLGSSAFARHYSRNHSCSLLLPLLGCFGSRRSPRPSGRCPAFSRAGSPIRTPADPGPFAPPRGFSQLVTSFLASESHRHPPCALLVFLVSGTRSRTRRALFLCSPALSLYSPGLRPPGSPGRPPASCKIRKPQLSHPCSPFVPAPLPSERECKSTTIFITTKFLVKNLSSFFSEER